MFFQLRRAVRRIFCSYLSLLVNTKNDLALAHTLDTPCRSLGCTAFTDVKHAAQNSSTSLFLVDCSTVVFTIQHVCFNIMLITKCLSWFVLGNNFICAGHTTWWQRVCTPWIWPFKKALKRTVSVCPFYRPIRRDLGRNLWPQVKCFLLLT